jgi:GDP-4-dehydro-6-deoxy-D-mannose reductase
MVALITGACGFVAKYLAEHLRDDGCRVIGIDQWGSCPVGLEYHQVDIQNVSALSALLGSHGISRVYHLAAVSYLPDADATPRRALETNIMGTVSLLDAVRAAASSARVLLVGSSKEYGSQVESDSLAETCPPGPSDFYGISKYAGEMIGAQYARQFAMDIRFTRSFNHTGPGQSPRFVCSEWAKQVAAIHLGISAPALRVGDLGNEIDFLDVRDVVSAYRSIIEKGQAGEVYNVCSGRAVSLEYVLDHLLRKASIPIEVVRTEAKLRAHKASPRLAGDNRKLRDTTGWSPQLPIEKTLDDLFDYWLDNLRTASSP